MIADLTAKARKLAGILAVPAWRAALRRHRVAAGVEHARVLRTLGEVRTVVDIGANRGQFALAARCEDLTARTARPSGLSNPLRPRAVPLNQYVAFPHTVTQLR